MAAFGRATAVGAAALALFAAGCGSEERELTPQEFVTEMNQHGASLSLGPVITQNPEGVDVNEVTLERTAPTPTGEGSKPRPSGTGTLLAFDDADAAAEEYDRCEGAPALTCFRAGNVVLRVEDLQPTDQALLTSATQGLADDAP